MCGRLYYTTLHYTRAMSGSVVQCGTLDLDSGGRKEYHSCNLLNKLKSMLAFHSLTWTVPSSQSQLLLTSFFVWNNCKGILIFSRVCKTLCVYIPCILGKLQEWWTCQQSSGGSVKTCLKARTFIPDLPLNRTLALKLRQNTPHQGWFKSKKLDICCEYW